MININVKVKKPFCENKDCKDTSELPPMRFVAVCNKGHINDIDWYKRNFKSYKQELLCLWHGFYYESHRAMMDINALIHLLTHSSYIKNKPIVELIQNAKKPVCRVEALFAKFEYKNLLKKRNYKWYNSGKNKEGNFWYKIINHNNIDDERDWLNRNIYNGQFQGRFIEITIIDKYKN